MDDLKEIEVALRRVLDYGRGNWTKETEKELMAAWVSIQVALWDPNLTFLQNHKEV